MIRIEHPGAGGGSRRRLPTRRFGRRRVQHRTPVRVPHPCSRSRGGRGDGARIENGRPRTVRSFRGGRDLVTNPRNFAGALFQGFFPGQRDERGGEEDLEEEAHGEVWLSVILLSVIRQFPKQLTVARGFLVVTETSIRPLRFQRCASFYPVFALFSII